MRSVDHENSARVSATLTKVGFHQNGASNEITNGAAIAITGCPSRPCRGPLLRLRIKECQFTNNKVHGGGGALFGTFCNVEIRTSEFTNNEAELAGGSVYLIGVRSRLQIKTSIFNHNGVRSVGSNAEIRQANGLPLESSRYFTFAFPGGSGGALATDTISSLAITGSSFKANRAPAGGAITMIFREQTEKKRKRNSFNVEIEDCEFERNGANSTNPKKRSIQENHLGGAVYLVSSATNLEWKMNNSSFIGNTARHGGALHMVTLRSVKPEIQNCIFKENKASGAGGGVLARNTGSIRLAATTFSRNTADFGGGIMLTNSAMLSGLGLAGIHLRRRRGVPNLFTGNSAVDGGGLMCAGCGDVRLDDSVFSSNSAEGSGGGVYCLDTQDPIILSQITLENNSASLGGGAAFLAAAQVQISSANFPGFFSSITNNKASAGGGVYLKGNRQQENRIRILRTVFQNNSATRLSKSDSSLTDCANGGGGGICLVLDQIPDRSIADVRIQEVNFTNNKASVGGGIFVEVDGELWNEDLSALKCPDPTPSRDTCRLLAFSDIRFKGNQAYSYQPDMFISDSSLLVVGCPRTSLENYVPWNSVSPPFDDVCLYFINNKANNTSAN